MAKTKVLFLCVHNSARSQMAEAFLRDLAPSEYEAYSAGLEPTSIDPLVVEVMGERGMDVSDWRAKGVKEYLGRVHFGYLITVCLLAEESCPTTFPGISTHLNWSFADPANAQGSYDERLAVYRETRDQIEKRVREWVAEQRGADASQPD